MTLHSYPEVEWLLRRGGCRNVWRRLYVNYLNLRHDVSSGFILDNERGAFDRQFSFEIERLAKQSPIVEMF